MTGLTEDSIAAVVDLFYARVREDPVLGPVFADAISHDEWPAHLAVIRDFWSAVVLKTGRYRGNPFSVHQRIRGMRPELFDRWLALFHQTSFELLRPDSAQALYGKAVMIADSLEAGLFSRGAVTDGSPPI